MTDAIARTAARKAALDAARTALRSGSRSQLESALRELPGEGKKAAHLRESLLEALRKSADARTERLHLEGLRAVCTSDGVKYEFQLAETGDISLFHPKREGTHVRVIINTAHPFGRQLKNSGDWKNTALLTLLAAWAHYELEQSDDQLECSIRDARIDWGRAVRRLLAADIGFLAEQQ